MPTPTALFTINEARAFVGPSGEATLTDAARYPDTTIAAAEERIRAEFTAACSVAFIPTTSTEYVDGSGTDTLHLDSHNPLREHPARGVTVTSITVTDENGTATAFTADESADLVCYPGKLVRRSGNVFLTGHRNVAVVYTHGYAAVPALIKEAALRRAVFTLVKTGVNPLVQSMSMGGTSWSFVAGSGPGRLVGQPDVDEILQKFDETLPGIA